MDKKTYDTWMKQFDETVTEMRYDFSKQLQTDEQVQEVVYTCKFSVGELPLVIKETTKAIVVKEDEYADD